jgi:Icc-related predicted phosphoesterase
MKGASLRGRALCAAAFSACLLCSSVFLCGCRRESGDVTGTREPPVRYVLQGSVLKQVTGDSDDEMRSGVLADTHGTHRRIGRIAQVFQERNVDAILIAGDMEGKTRSLLPLANEKDVAETVEPCARTGLPVFVVPGNHDQRKSYAGAMEKLCEEYDNVYDMTTIRVVDGDDADVVSLPGGHAYVVIGGFECGDDDILEVKALAAKCDDQVVLLSHFPMRFDTKEAIDWEFGANRGSRRLREVIEESHIHFGVSGHMHGAGKRGVDLEGNRVNEGELSDYLYFNPGPGSEHNAGIFTVKGGRARYEHLSVK